MPAIVRDVDDTTSLEHALVENIHRQDLNALEEAAAYQQLIEDFHLTHDQVAAAGGQEPGGGDQHAAPVPAAARHPEDGRRRRPVSGTRPCPARHPGPGLPGAARSPRDGRRPVGARGRGSRARSGPSWRARSPSGTGDTTWRHRNDASASSEHLGCSSSRSCSRTTSTPASASRWARTAGRVAIDFADLEDLERIYRGDHQRGRPDRPDRPEQGVTL